VRDCGACVCVCLCVCVYVCVLGVAFAPCQMRRCVCVLCVTFVIAPRTEVDCQASGVFLFTCVFVSFNYQSCVNLVEWLAISVIKVMRR